MDKLVKLTIPNYIYRFYADASAHVFDYSAEELMADALSAYAGLLSDTVSKERERQIPEEAKGKM